MYRHGDEEIQAVERVIRSGQWYRYGDSSLGHLGEAATFESEWAQVVGSEFACFTSSGTAALLCCYAGLELGPGDEVIVPGYTWITTALAPLHLGVIPVLVDVNESLTIDPTAVERAINPRTKAISPVHMNGLMADMGQLHSIAKEHDLFLIEDACQCDGGRWHDGRYAGAMGDMGAYSFNYFKVISCGDGGMFVTNKAGAFERGLIYHDAGVMFRPHAKEVGVDFFAGINLRGSEILAAIIRIQASRLGGIVTDLLRNRELIVKQIDGSVEQIPYNGGLSTGTGAFVGLRFSCEEEARRFTMAFNSDSDRQGAISYLPIDSGRHVFSNWEPLLHRRGSHTEAADPFRHPSNSNAPTYSANMLPRTLEILRTTVLLDVSPDWSGDECDQVAACVRRAAT